MNYIAATQYCSKNNAVFLLRISHLEDASIHNVSERGIARERDNRIKGQLKFDVVIKDDISIRLQDEHQNTFFLNQDVQNRIGTRAIIIGHDIIVDRSRNNSDLQNLYIILQKYYYYFNTSYVLF